MNRMNLVSLALAVLSVGVSACAGASAGPAVVLTCDDFQAANHINREVQVSAGEVLVVDLCSNTTTGFSWEPARIEDGSVLQQLSEEFKAPDSKAVGAAGRNVWRFKALSKGTSTVSLAYSRPWGGGEKGLWTLTLTILVR